MQDELLNFHIKNDFYISADEVEENCVLVNFPQNIIDDIPTDKIIYEVSDGHVGKLFVDNNVRRNLEVPNYAKRIVVLHDFILMCTLLNISSVITVCTNLNGIAVKSNIMNLFKKPEDEETINKEKRFINFYSDFINGERVKFDEFSDAYSLILELNKSGGI